MNRDDWIDTAFALLATALLVWAVMATTTRLNDLQERVVKLERILLEERP